MRFPSTVSSMSPHTQPQNVQVASSTIFNCVVAAAVSVIVTSRFRSSISMGIDIRGIFIRGILTDELFDQHIEPLAVGHSGAVGLDRKSTRLNSSHSQISYAVFCLKK